ncbi:hypothetical protein PLICRDRAFT_671098 [Plicaturopsis crispa FD-325 SS-3]|uniref:Antifreeze protein n=1 Tax=Plicaturopsis crispa FD-325 SS-3 TaxID=944288 RepID=A0A0C9T819_PLICR|nr:hypothetical protein PLICRDRAFT_671098 [Plicaturopsis crispa FD-325 SS-3]
MKDLIYALVSALTLVEASSHQPRRFFPYGHKLFSRANDAVVVNLGTAINYSILTKSGISSVAPSQIQGNIAVSPIASTAITGFALMMDASGTFSTSTQVSGRVYAADYTPPTPATLTTAVNDMQAAYNQAAAETPVDFSEFQAGALGGATLVPGIYKFSTGVNIATDVTLTGTCNDVYVFQIAGALTQAAATNVILTGTLLASRIFWQTATGATIGAGASFQGTILSAAAVTIQTGAAVTGRVYGQANVALQQAMVRVPPAFDAATCAAATTTATTATTATATGGGSTTGGGGGTTGGGGGTTAGGTAGTTAGGTAGTTAGGTAGGGTTAGGVTAGPDGGTTAGAGGTGVGDTTATFGNGPAPQLVTGPSVAGVSLEPFFLRVFVCIVSPVRVLTDDVVF